MDDTLHISLIILAFLILISWSIFDALKLRKKLKSKKYIVQKEGIQDLKNYGKENIFLAIINIIVDFLRKIF